MTQKKNFCPTPYQGIFLFNAGGDVTTRWFIYYSAPHRVKKYKGINTTNDPQERTRRAMALAAQIACEGLLKPSAQLSADLGRLLQKTLLQKKHLLRKKSYQTYESKVRKFSAWLIKQKISKPDAFTSLHAVSFMEWLRREGRNVTTVNTYKRTLQQFFQTLIKQQVITINPFATIKCEREQPKGSLYFRKHQVEELRQQIQLHDQQLWLAVQLLFYCFVRPGEARNLIISDFYLEESKIRLRGEISKNKKEQFVSIPNVFSPELLKLKLHQYPDHWFLIGKDNQPGPDPVGINYLSKSHRVLIRKLNYGKRYNLYSWKHTGAVMAVSNGINLKDLQMQLRHHSLDQVNEYLRDLGVIDSEDLRNKYPSL